MSDRQPVVKIIAESLSQHDEKHVVLTPFSVEKGRKKKSVSGNANSMVNTKSMPKTRVSRKRRSNISLMAFVLCPYAHPRAKMAYATLDIVLFITSKASPHRGRTLA
jgi:hypothetical protein